MKVKELDNLAGHWQTFSWFGHSGAFMKTP